MPSTTPPTNDKHCWFYGLQQARICRVIDEKSISVPGPGAPLVVRQGRQPSLVLGRRIFSEDELSKDSVNISIYILLCTCYALHRTLWSARL